MTTYSLPIAALFATTVVYGRLAADNELVACRAAGLSYWSLLMPGLVLGLIVAIVSLLLLCFIVPVFSLRVEQVIYSNLGRIITNSIERTHQLKMDETTIFAQSAEVAPDDPNNPNEQLVRLTGLMIVSYEDVESSVKDTPKLKVPRDIYLAKESNIFIRKTTTGDFTIDAELRDGAMFPRTFAGKDAMQGGIAQTHFGPKVMESMIREETKFMDIRRLHELAQDESKGRKMQVQVQKIVRAAQENVFLNGIQQQLRQPNSTVHFDAGGEQYDLVAPKGGAEFRQSRLIIAPAKLMQRGRTATTEPAFTWDAAELELSAKPIDGGRLAVQATLHNVVAQTPEGETARTSFARHFTTPMPQELEQLAHRNLDFYLSAPGVPASDRALLHRERIRLINGIQSEMHSRASFAISCLILVIVGCALGMMFKSGNFLSAFALSVVPALLCISLIVAGQHTCENVPWKLENFHNPLTMGLAIIWSGNVVVLALAIALWSKLARE
jgi:lipopolysaccharide export LptBFGC system permease protein LptF